MPYENIPEQPVAETAPQTAETAPQTEAPKKESNGLATAATVISNLFSPLLMATYAVALAMQLSFLSLVPLQMRLIVLLVTFLATTALPVIAIFLLIRFGVVKDPMLNRKDDRTWPYIIEALCFIGVAIYFYTIHAPLWLVLFILGGTMALITLTVVNRWWKISGHATGAGAICAIVFYLIASGNSIFSLTWEFIAICLLAGLICTSRLILGRHTLGQVAAGFLNGFLWVFLAAWLFQAAPVPVIVQ